MSNIYIARIKRKEGLLRVRGVGIKVILCCLYALPRHARQTGSWWRRLFAASHANVSVPTSMPCVETSLRQTTLSTSVKQTYLCLDIEYSPCMHPLKYIIVLPTYQAGSANYFTFSHIYVIIDTSDFSWSRVNSVKYGAIVMYYCFIVWSDSCPLRSILNVEYAINHYLFQHISNRFRRNTCIHCLILWDTPF